MAETITHQFVSAKLQSSDPTIVSKNEWNDTHRITGGFNGQILTYNTVNAPSNIKFIDSAIQHGNTYTVPGSTALPVTVATISVTTRTPCLAIITLNTFQMSLAGGQGITYTLRADSAPFKAFTTTSTTTDSRSFTQILSLPTPGTRSFNIVITGVSNITTGSLAFDIITIGS